MPNVNKPKGISTPVKKPIYTKDPTTLAKGPTAGNRYEGSKVVQNAGDPLRKAKPAGSGGFY